MEPGKDSAIAEAVAAIQRLVAAKGGNKSIKSYGWPSLGLVLGSGLGSFAETLQDPVVVPYAEIPGFPVSTVSGHAGKLVVGSKHGKSVVAMQGRVHFYEGHSAREVVFPIRVMIALGAKTLIITNAAGGLTHPAGTLMLISDHLNLLPDHPLRGPNFAELGPRFPDMTEAYSKEFRAKAQRAAQSLGFALPEGVYAALQGPSYETPAEIRMLSVLGADAVGMSTVPEVIAANHMGAKVLGISCITNQAAGMSGGPLSHHEVQLVADQVKDRFCGLLDAMIKELG